MTCCTRVSLDHVHFISDSPPKPGGYTMTNPPILGCGEWCFRNRTIPEYFATATALGFRHLEFGIGGGWTGRLSGAPTASDVAAFRRLAKKLAVTTRYCCLENDFTRPDPAEHAAQLRTTL